MKHASGVRTVSPVFILDALNSTPMKLSELAELTGATCNPDDSEIEIAGAAGLDQAQSGQVTFLSNPRYTSRVNDTSASAIYVAADFELARQDVALLRAKDPYLAFTRALIAFQPEREFESFRDQSAAIDSSTRIPSEAFIGAHVAIGKNCSIGERVRIHANATIYDHVEIGDDSEIHSGVAIPRTARRAGTAARARSASVCSPAPSCAA